MTKQEKATIEVNSITKKYGKKENEFLALKNVTLTIYKGETVAITGKSGSGKSTLMHHLALLDSPTSGTIAINNRIASKLSQREINKLRNKQFGFVFQQFFLNGEDSVLENVVLPLKIAGESRKTRIKKGLEALKEVGIDKKAQDKANNLSGGEKQRVIIARALINSPSIIFADEPTGNLDSVNGSNIVKLLFNLNKSRNITLIVVTHDNDLAKRFDRQVIIKDGKILKIKERQAS